MTQKPVNNNTSLPKAPSEKAAFVQFIERKLNLQPDCSVIDLDIPINQNSCPSEADLSIWVDSWHNFVELLASYDDAEVGVRAARDMLYELSCHYKMMVFSADTTKPPLDQFGLPDKSLDMLFRESTCYTSIRPIAVYRGRKVYLGENPDASIKKLSLFY